MEEQGANSTMVFKNRHPPSKPQKKDKESIYCNVEMKAPASTLKPTPGQGDKKAVHGRDFYVLAAVLVVVFVLLLVSIAALVYLIIMMTNQRAENQQLMEQKSELENRTQLLSSDKNELLNLTQDLSRQRDALQNSTEQLMKQKSELENRTHLLSREKNVLLGQQKDSINWTLRTIMAFECQPCPKKWIPFKDHCYFFFNETSSWKQWDQSQTYCKELNPPISDLVVIESLEEQEFVHSHIQYYYDALHGFWIGLSQNSNNNWVWVDGQTDTLGFLMKTALGTSGPKALMIPNQTLTESWSPAKNVMQNKFICESKALIKV